MSYQSVGNRNNFLFIELFLSVVFLLSFQLRSQAAESIALSWNASDPAAARFEIYYGMASHYYSGYQIVGNTNQTVIAGLNFGTTYYFAVSETDTNGHQSGLSSEIHFVAGSATLTSVNIGGHRMIVNLQGSTGQRYFVQSSTNLVDWAPYQTNAAPFQFTTTSDPTIAQQYFRACRSE
jgi:hypothetical protein